MKKILYIYILIILTYQGMGQAGIQNQGIIKIPSGAILKVTGATGDFTNNEDGKVVLDGTIKLEGDWTNNSGGDPVFINTNGVGSVYFVGTSAQLISGGNYTLFENLYLNNSSGVSIGYFTQVENVLSLTSTILDLNAYNFRIGSINNLTGTFSSSNMITSSNGGYFQFTPTMSTWNYIPLGSNNGAAEYSRLAVYPYSGTVLGANARVSVRVEDSKHPNNNSSTNFLNRYWQIDSYDISAINFYVNGYYLQDDVDGTETSLSPGQYTGSFWTPGSYMSTTGNYIRYNQIKELGDFTAGEADKFQVSISASNETVITEGSENGKTILVTVYNGSFVATPNISSWAVYNLPEGVALGSVSYIDANNVRLYLSGNRTVDFDVSITDIEIVVNFNDVNNLNSGTISDNTGTTITAINDTETLTMSDDGDITEGAESGEIIAVTLLGGTFANPIDETGWELNYLPSGISYSIIRNSATLASITLTSNTNIDYDIDNDTLEVIIPGTDIDDYAGTSLSVNTGVTFTAIDEPLTLSMGTTLNDTITEGAENGEIIEITITGDTFVSSLTDGQWSVSNLPIGVTWTGSANYINANTVQLPLSGNRTIDYDTDIENLSVFVAANQITSYGLDVIVSSGVVFEANNDTESFTFSTTTLPEGNEDGKTVSVYLSGGTFNNPLNLTEWSVSNLPEGVSIGSVAYVNSAEATITLSGNATIDYDADIDFNLSVNKNQLSDIDAPLTGTASALLEAFVDIETLTILGSIIEGAEDGSVIKVALTGGTFESIINPAYFTVSNLPSGVEIDSISYMYEDTVYITLIGNATSDYDINITNTTVVVDELAYNDSDGDLTVNTGVTFIANDETATIVLSELSISEESEDGTVLTVNLSEDIFASTMDATNCLIQNLPLGVSVGNYNRVSDTELELMLSGNRTIDFDTSIDNVYVEVLAAGLQQHNYNISSANIEITATNDTEILSFSTQTILEGAEDGSEVEVILSGGTFAPSLTALNWSISNGPDAISISGLNRISSDTVIVSLARSSSVDYDSDIELGITIQSNEVDDYTGIAFEISSGVKFEAIIEPVGISMQNNGATLINEASEDGGEIIVSVDNDEWVDPLVITDWTVSNLPVGVSVDTIIRQSSTDVLIRLQGNRLIDYDQNIDTVQVEVLGTQFVNQSSNLSINSGVLITALNDNESISFTPVSITERQEEAAEIEVILNGGTFASELNIANWSFSGLPSGVSLAEVNYISSTSAKLVLTGNSDTDYDSDITSLSLTVTDDEIDDRPAWSVTASSGVTFVAIIEQVSFVLPGGALTEDNVNESIVELNLAGDEFVDFGLDIANFTLNNAPAGLTLGSIEYIDAQTAYISLAFNRTDFDVDYNNLSITVGADEITSASAISTGTFSVTAVIELPYIILSDNGLLEGSESSGYITVSLFEDIFKSTLTPSSWQVNNLPLGISVNSYVRVNETTVNIILQGNREQDYDVNVLNTSVTALASELTEGLSDVTSSTGVIFIAVNDNEAIDFSPAQIFEGAENNQSITLNLTGGTFVSDINYATWEFANLPEGVSVNTVTLSDSTTAIIELAGTRTMDYDANIDNFQVIIPNADVDDFSNGTLIANTGITFVANNEMLTTATTEILEQNLNGTVLTYSLIHDAFVDNVIDPNSITVSNMPENCNINTITYINDTAFSISLTYNNNDFDTDFGLLVEIDAIELLGLTNIVANEVVITANDDIEIVSMQDDSNGIFETQESGEIIAVSLTGGNFSSILNLAEWSIINIPDGIEYSINYINSQLINIELTSNSSIDYDTDVELGLSIPESDIYDYSGNNMAALGTVLFKAYNESLSISAVLEEQSLNGSTISVNLTDEIFVDGTIEPSNIVLNNAPNGLSVSSVSYSNSKSANVVLAYSLIDFDVNVENFYITILSNEIRGNADLNSDSLLITAEIEQENIEIAHNGLTEENLNNAVILLTTSFINFSDQTLAASNFILNGAPDGTTVSQVTYLTDSTANLELAFDGTDFDSDYDISVTILAAELSKNSTITTNRLTVVATNDEEIINLSSSVVINESSEDGAIVNVSLEGGQFVSSLDFSNWVVQDLPDGVSAINFVRQSSTAVQFQLSGNTTVDYDIDKTISIVIPASDINDTDIPVVSTVGFVLTALNDEEVITMADDGNISEGIEDGEIVILSIEGGDFATELNTGWFMFTNMPTGITVGSVTRNNDTQVTLQLLGNAVSDYDGDLELILQISDEAIDDFNDGVYIITSGVTFHGQYEVSDRVLSIYGDDLFEETLDGSVLELNLAHEVFVDATLDVSSFTLHNVPTGVTIQSVSYVDNENANVTLSFDGTDFDLDSTNVTIEVAGAELSTGVNLLSSNTTITASTESPELNIFHIGLNQVNLNGAEIAVSLKYDTFVDATLDIVSVTLNNAPIGLSVSSFIYVSATSATLTLSFDGTVFNDNILDFSILLNGSEFLANGNLTSNALNIASGTEASLVASALAEVVETNIDGMLINLQLIGGTFTDNSLATESFQLLYAPKGVSVGSVNYMNNQEAEISLSYSGADFDENIDTVTIQIAAVELNSGTNLLSNHLLFTAISDEETLQLVSVSEIYEGEEDSHGFSANLNGGTFIELLDMNLWTLANLPEGVVLDTIERVNANKVNFTITGRRTVDYDDNLIVNLQIDGSQIDDYESATIQSDSSVTFIAIVENPQALLTASGLAEDNLDEQMVVVDLLEVQFTTESIQVADFTLLNAPAGVSISSVSYITQQKAQLMLAYNGMDFDVDFNASIIVSKDVIIENTDIESNTVTITAIQELVDLNMDHLALNENNLNNAQINLSLSGSSFASAIIDASGITMKNSPAGLSANTFTRVSDTTAIVGLVFDGTDFDTNFVSFSMLLDQKMVVPEQVIESHSSIIYASIEPNVQISFDGEITEGNEAGEVITVALLEGKFVNELSIDSIEMPELPLSLQLGNLNRVSDTLLSYEIASSRTIDYDTDISSVSCILHSGMFQDYYGSEVDAASSISLKAFNENVTIAHNGLTRGNLNGAEIDVILTDDYFITDQLNASFVTLQNIPSGVAVHEIVFNSNTQATLVLSFDGTAFIENFNDFYIELSAECLFGIENLVSNSLVIDKGVSIVDNNNLLDVDIYSAKGVINILLSSIPSNWESAGVSVFSTDGRKIYEEDLEKMLLNQLKLDVQTANYFVKVNVNGLVYTNKVFVKLE